MDALLADLDRNGVHAAILVQPSVYGWDHSLLFDSIARFPDRLAGVALLNHADGAWRVRLRELLDRDARGVRFNLHQHPGAPWVGDPAHAELFTALIDSQVPVCLHARHDQLESVDALAGRYPGLVLVVDHLGRPAAAANGWSRGALDALAERPSVFLKLSGFQACGPAGTWPALAPLLLDLVSRFGADRLMWGSDAPSSLGTGTYAQTLATVTELGLAPAQLDAILGGTARRVFGLARA